MACQHDLKQGLARSLETPVDAFGKFVETERFVNESGRCNRHNLIVFGVAVLLYEVDGDFRRKQ